MPTNPIQSPASYVPSRAAAFSDVDGNSLLVSNANPLPVAILAGGTGSVPVALTGTTTTTSVLGPYQPSIDRSIMLALSGTWTGTVKVLRSTDGGVTKLPLTVAGTTWGQFTANACEPVWEDADAASRFYLDVTLASGTLAYRLSQ